MFFLLLQNVTSERAPALMPKLIRWWEAVRGPEVAKWQQKYRVDRDATDGRNGGAQRTVWEVLMEMERFNGRTKAEDRGAVALELHLAKAFERVNLPVVWAWAKHFSFPRKILRVLCGYFEHQRRGCVAEPLQTITAFLPRSKWSGLPLRIVLQDALSEVTNIYPSLKLRVFVDDIAALVQGGNKDVAEMAKKVMKKLKEEVEKKGLKLSVTENGKEGKSKMVASCGFLESELKPIQKRRRSDLGRQCGNAGSGLKNKGQEVGSERKSEKKKVQGEVLDYQEE